MFGGSDPDQCAYGDLPYACDVPYSKQPEKFLGPTRVVGRLPDLTGANNSAYIINLLERVANWTLGMPEDYADFFGLTAAVWQESTKLSLRNIFGTHSGIKLSPPDGPAWGTILKHKAHFINCHGAPGNPAYYGQHGNSYPIAHEANRVKGKLTSGTVATGECCYGAELYDSFELNEHPSIVNTYLESGSYGFFGSSTIAYGPAIGNGAADFRC